MRKLLPSTIKRREEARKNREAMLRWMEEISMLDAVRCNIQQDPYSDEHDADYLAECVENLRRKGVEINVETKEKKK